MWGKPRFSSAHVAILTLVAAACASPGASVAPPAEEPHAPTVRAVRSKVDSIETRIDFLSARLSARIDTLRSLINGLPGRSLPPDTGAFSESAAIRSGVVDGSTIAGMVADAETGRPLHGAQVAVVGTQWGTLSNDSGQFRLRRVPPGDHELRAVMLGYESVTVEVPGGSSEGVAVRFVLHPHVWTSCEGLAYRGVGVIVRDALTGRAPATATALRVSNGHEHWWDLGHAEPGADRLALAVQVGDGPLEVEVAAEGYATWYGSVVEAPSTTVDPCAGDPGRQFNVWLLPTQETTAGGSNRHRR